MSTQPIDIEWIASSIQEILNKVHTTKGKLTIKKKHDRLTFACPICGDSHKDNNLKRGHLFFSNLHFKCYNEGCFSTFTKLCKDFKLSLDPEKRLNLINWVAENTLMYKNSEDNVLASHFDKAIKMEELQEWFDSGLGPLKHFKKVSFGSKCYSYLIGRGFIDSQIGEFYEGIKVTGKWSEPYLVFLNRVGDRILGMQERNIQSGEKRKFKIWTFSELYRSIHLTEIDQLEAIPYNKVSQLFNIFSVNYDKPITVFEAYIDSKFFPNSIGAVGLNTDFNFLIKNELDIRFFFDYDNVGKRKSKEWLKRGCHVFLWDKFILDWVKAQDSEFYSTMRWVNENIKDLNDIVKKMELTSYKELLKYFSNDVLDLIWITDDKKKIYKRVKEKPSIHDVDLNYKIRELR